MNYLPTQPVLYKCTNPNCCGLFDIEKAQDQVSKKGLGFAHCLDVIYQVIDCFNPECRGKLIACCHPENPVLDMRNTILFPQRFGSNREQVYILTNRPHWHPYLRFQFFPGWDSGKISQEEFIALSIDHINDALNHPYASQFLLLARLRGEGPSLFMDRKDFNKIMYEEINTGQNCLRRLYPDTEFYWNFIRCILPGKIRAYGIFDEGKFMDSDLCLQSDTDFQEEMEAWKYMLKKATGQTLEEAVISKFKSKNFFLHNNFNVDDAVHRVLCSRRHYERDASWESSVGVTSEEEILSLFRKEFRSMLHSICTKPLLEDKRQELTSWVNEAEEGKALFVNTIMGLGKTFSIVEALTSNLNLSAIIFMPTKEHCEDLVEKLKDKIPLKLKRPWINWDRHREEVYDDNGNLIYEEFVFPKTRYKRYFLKNHVYYMDGINRQECPHFDEFIERYRKGLFSKSEICKRCDKYSDTSFEKEVVKCRFRRHNETAFYSRIIVTTHRQYLNICRNSNMKNWHRRDPESGEKIVTKRDFFIVDEDIIMPLCYEPVVLNTKELNSFGATITNFLNNTDNFKKEVLVNDKAIDYIEKISGKFAHCSDRHKSEVVPPINPKFEIPGYILRAWNKLFEEDNVPIPEIIDNDSPIGNHLAVYENAIRKGFVVQNYTAKFCENGNQDHRHIKKAFFPNPTKLDLYGLPTHVFFDGTKLKDKFIKNKLLNVEIKKMEINVEPIWDIKVWQNIWTDLPKSSINKDKEKVQRLLYDLINERGPHHKYFIVTKKAIREGYLEKWLEETFPRLDYVLAHFGNLRGVNKAEDCDIGIMLGSYSPPDVVEIAMAMDFIQNELKPHEPITTKNNLWTKKNKNHQRVYKDNFSVIREIAAEYRLSEHRQALARTRYLLHDVDFYIFSKDPVSSYETYLPSAGTENYRNDLFSKQRRNDSDYPNTVKAVAEWLASHRKVARKDISTLRGVREGTIGKHLMEMVDEGLLEKPNPRGHFYYLSSDYLVVDGEFKEKNK